jgi:hypothetical protein
VNPGEFARPSRQRVAPSSSAPQKPVKSFLEI